MEINWEAAQAMAQEWDIPAIERMLDQAAAKMPQPGQEGGAMDMYGSAASPQGVMPSQGMGWGSVFAGAPNAPAAGGMPGANLGATGMQLTQPQQSNVRPAPASAPRRAPPMQFPGIPKIDQVPSLGQLLGGRR